jgi:hypothetical protein
MFMPLAAQSRAIQNDALLLHLTNFDRRQQQRRSAAGAATTRRRSAAAPPADTRAWRHMQKIAAVTQFVALAVETGKLDAADRVELPSDAELEALPSMEAMSRLRDAERVLLTKLGAMSEPIHKRVESAFECVLFLISLPSIVSEPFSRWTYPQTAWTRSAAAPAPLADAVEAAAQPLGHQR